ncbi:MAG: phytanoyl-CoA dioxygenase family protein [Qipengyuania sp.]|nr:phytanoyl-CoA dioxygenase family protein [Qipengyuania sp.]
MARDPALLTARLLADGYCIIPDLIAPELVALLDDELGARFATTPFCEGGFYGARTKRFGALLRRSRHAEQLVRHPLVLRIVEAALRPWCDRFALSLTQAVELHPGALAQYPHRDEDIYGGAKGEVEYQVNVIWPLTPFTAANGATMVWPHGDMEGTGIAAEMAPGSALLWLGSTLHGGGGNSTTGVRRGVIVGYCLGWLKPFENQWLVYPPEVAKHFNPELAALVGYAQHRPNLGNVEGQCPTILFRDDTIDGLAATDALRSDQAEALAGYVAEQEAARRGPPAG